MSNSTPHFFTRQEIVVALLATLICLMGPFSSDGYTPSLPAMSHYFNSSASTMQLTITVYLIGASLSQLIYGPLSDKLGRKKIVLLGLTICFIGSVLCTLATSSHQVIMGRLVQGIGAGASNALFRAIMRDMFSGNRLAKVMAYTSMIFTLGLVSAPVIGGYLQTSFGWRSNFIFLALLSLTIILASGKFLKETNLNLNPHAMRVSNIYKNYYRLLSCPAFMGYNLCAAFAIAGFFTYYAVTPFLFQNELGVSASHYGLLSLCIGGALILGNVVNSQYVVKLGTDRLLVMGIYSMLISALVLIGTEKIGEVSVLSVILPTMLFFIGAGLIFANAMTGALTPFADIAGSAGALYGCLQFLVAFSITLLVAALHLKGVFGLAVSFLGLGVLAWLGFYGLVRMTKLAVIKSEA